MSLKIWLPLNGDLKDKGINQVTVAPSATVTYGTGKVTEKSFSGGSTYIKFPWEDSKTNAFSVAMWVKPNTPAAWQDIFSFGDSNNRIEVDNTLTQYRWYSNANTLVTSGSVLFSLPNEQWNHIAMTLNGTKVYFYLNGVLAVELTQANTLATAFGDLNELRLGCRTTTGSSQWKGFINDVRVYNHCLTPREVKQVAQGLVLHYKLSDGITRNLISSLESGGRTSLSGTHSFNANFYENVDTYAWINVSPALELNKTYTLSFDVSNFPAGSKWTWQLWNSANYALIVDNNGHYSYTFKVEAAKLPSDYSLTKFLFDDGGRTGPANVVTFSNFKLEEGDTDTIWTPNANIDYLNYESDCGGYRLNGTRVGTVKNSLSTGRYKQSRKFDNNQYIYCSHAMTMTDATISAWLKIDTYPSSGYMLAFADQVSKIAFGFYNGNSAIISCGDSTNNSSVIVDLKSKWDLSKWHLVTITKKGSDYKFYFDGKLWTNLGSSNYWTMTATNMLCIGCRNNGSYADFYKGLMSDFRIYATALNETDVKILYDSSLSFLENAVFQAYCIEDASVHNIKMTEQGVLKSGSFSEIGYIGGMKIKTLPDGSAWARIHWLDRTRDKTLFVDDKEVAFCDKSNRFSLMGLVDHFKTPEGVYEFMLTYPSKSATAYNRWSQTSSPNAAYGAHTGLNIIHTDYTSHKNAITKSSSSGSATYSMNASGNWWAPIGQKADYSSGIPAANGETLMSTELWVRINNLNNITKISMLDDKYLQAFEIKEI